MTDMFPKNSISLDLHEDIEIESIIDSRAETNYTSDILNHRGGIILADFERKNIDFQPLTNDSNSKFF